MPLDKPLDKLGAIRRASAAKNEFIAAYLLQAEGHEQAEAQRRRVEWLPDVDSNYD